MNGGGRLPEVTRRDLMKLLAYGGSAGVLAGAGCSSPAERTARPRSTTTARPSGSGGSGRILVVVELGGGNDGLSTVVPFESGAYRDLRPTVALGADDVIDWGDGWGLNRNLAPLHERGLTALAGVGTPAPDLSHFAMVDRWWRGDPDGTLAVAGLQTGFLGRICDALDERSQPCGVSLRFGDSPIMRAEVASTVGLGSMTSLALTDPKALDSLRRTVDALSSGHDMELLEDARTEMRGIVEVLRLVDTLPQATAKYPDTDLGLQMAFTSRLIRADAGVRVIHVPMGGGNRFDTHQNHAPQHTALMVEFADAVAALMDDLEAQHDHHEVLIATISEFGRRAGEHDGGLDHGTASTMMLLGPTVEGIHGEHPSLTELDDLGDLVATISFDRYYATLASWLDVDLDRVLPRSGAPAPEPIPGLLAS